MHILLIHQAFASVGEAGGTRHFEMAEYFIRHGHKVTIITGQINYLTGKRNNLSNPQKFFDGNLTIYHTYTYPAFHKSFFHRLIGFFSFMASSFWQGVKVKEVDVLWGTSPPIFQGWTAWFLAVLKRKPFLFEVRDLWPAFAIAVGVLHNPVIIKLSEWLEKFLYKHADYVVVNSPGFINHVKTRGAKQVDLVPNGADIEMFAKNEPGDDVLFTRLKDKFNLVYAGAHGLSNDLDVILDAANMLKNNEKIHFIFVGDGKEKQNLIHRAEQLNLTNITWVPSVPKEQIGSYFNFANLGIAILKPIEMYKTTYPNKVFDYMASGLPVLLVIDGVIRDVVEQADAGVFAKPGDAHDIAAKIMDLFTHQEKLQEFSKNGKQFIQEKFNRENFSQSLLEIMEDLSHNG